MLSSNIRNLGFRVACKTTQNFKILFGNLKNKRVLNSPKCMEQVVEIVMKCITSKTSELMEQANLENVVLIKEDRRARSTSHQTISSKK